MGRKKIYKNEEERIEARRKRQRKYYRRNADHIKKYKMEKYYERKEMEKELS